MTDLATPRSERAPAATPAWAIIAEHDLKDLWLSGRGFAMILAHTVLLSISTYLVASNQELNFLEQRDAVSLTLKLAVVVGSLLVVLDAADAVSGERERGTLESLLLTPDPRRGLLLGKGAAALSLWLVAFAASLPYLWWVGRDVGLFPKAVFGGLLVGSMLAIFMIGLGLLVSVFSRSNLASMAISFFVLLILASPSQMPAEASRGWAGELLVRADPFSAGLLYLERLTVNDHSLVQNVGLLLAPLVAALVMSALALLASRRLALVPTLIPGSTS